MQTGGSIENTANSSLFFQSTANGSIVLNQNNRMVGSFNALSGNNYREPYQFKPQFGQSVVSITNASGLKVGNPGIDSDIVVIQAPSLATGAGGQVRARLPYNDKLLGESHSFPAMVLAVAQPVAAGFTLQDNQNEIVNGGQFQEISVEVGAPNTEELGGFLTVLPFKGSTLRSWPGGVFNWPASV
ncbi:MAG: hypothetical protein HC848_00080 [Limnobacter sp.]|nr:hypothetical protein [Limnobacter sp.]